MPRSALPWGERLCGPLPYATCGLLALLAICTLAAGDVRAQSRLPPAGRVVEVGVYVSPPFVIAKDGSYSGMAIDLWRVVATRLGLTSRYETYPTIRALIEATRRGDIDAAVTNLTITSGRAETVAFTQPWYDAGLRIMVPDEGSSGSFRSILAGLEDAGHLRAYGLLLLLLAAATLGLTLFDRRFDSEFHERWREGIAESFYHVVSVATSGRTAHKNLFGWKGWILSALWMLCGVALIAYITSSVTSVMTAESLERKVNSLSDLPGKTAGVFTGSVAEDYMTDLQIASRSYPDMDAAAAALGDGEIDAIVADAPILEHYSYGHPEQELAVVGRIFHPDKYGFAFPRDSDLVRPVTLQILRLREEGTIETLRSTYFGSAP